MTAFIRLRCNMLLRSPLRRYTCMLMAAIMVYAPAVAQKKHKKADEKVPVYNYVIDDPMDAFGRQQQQQKTTRTILMPEFCAGAMLVKDTVFRYEFYNAAHTMIVPDTLTNYTGLHFVSLLKSYPDPAHTYKDASGNELPLPVSKIIYRYDRTGNDKWLTVNYMTNKTYMLQEHVNETVKTDTINSTDGTTIIRRYYRVSQIQ